MRRFPIIILVPILAAVGLTDCSAKSAPGAGPTTTAAAPSGSIGTAPTTVAASPPVTTAAGPKTTFGDGTWAVGKDVAAGTYRTSGGSGCYWERDSDLTGSSNSILANDNLTGPGLVTILSSDAGFKSQGCGTWSPLPSSGPQATSFGDGVYAVGIDIAPGTYSTPGGSGCYWEQDSDFTFGPNSIISNDNPTGPVTVAISSSTKAFKTQGCGTWRQ